MGPGQDDSPGRSSVLQTGPEAEDRWTGSSRGCQDLEALRPPRRSLCHLWGAHTLCPGLLPLTYIHPPTFPAFTATPSPNLHAASWQRVQRQQTKISKRVLFLFQRCHRSVVAMVTPASLSEVSTQLPPVALTAFPTAPPPATPTPLPHPPQSLPQCPHRSLGPAFCSSYPGELRHCYRPGLPPARAEIFRGTQCTGR